MKIPDPLRNSTGSFDPILSMETFHWPLDYNSVTGQWESYDYIYPDLVLPCLTNLPELAFHETL